MSPLRLAYPGGTVEIVVHFAGKLNPQGTPEGNVTRVELWVNGVLVDTIQNPPNLKSGSVTFHLDLSRYGEGTIMLSAIAYQGNGKSAPSGASATKAVGVDLTDPTGTITIPTEGALVPSARPMARADYTDPPGAGGYHSGIDRASVRLYDEHGTDVTGDAEVGDSFLLYTPAPERALADGPHELRLHVSDFAGRTFEITRHFTTDTTPTGLTLETPADHASLVASDLAFSFSATDANGVALVSATVDGTEITERFARDGDRFTYTPHAGDTVVAELGPHTWHVVVADGAGNPTERSLSYTVVENPGGGGAPPPAYHLHILDGDGQTGVIGRCVEGPQIPGTQRTEPGRILKVLAVDDHAGGAIVSGLALGFDSAGFLAPAPGFSTVTNPDGVAAVQCILSRTEGDNTVTVGVIGDPTAIAVTFHETAVKPTLYTTLGMSTEPGFAGRTLLAKGGNGWVYATLTRPGDPGQLPIAISANVRLDVSKVEGGVATPAGESDMYVNPRSRMTTEHGAATFILIPELLTDTQWQAKLSIPDFPEIEPPPVSFASSGTYSAGDVVEIPELFTTQGGITAAGHPATLTVDVAPMVTHIPALAIRAALGWVVTDCALTVFGHATDENGLTLYRFTNVDGGSGTPTDGEWNDHHPDTHFALNVQPNVGSVGAFPWLMTASMRVVLVEPFTGAVAVGLYHERVVVGSPEIAFARADGRLLSRPVVSAAYSADWAIEPPKPEFEFLVEARGPLDGGATVNTSLHSLDWCGDLLTKPTGAVAGPVVSVPLEAVATTSRFIGYRTPTSIHATRETVPELPLEVDAITDRQLLYAQVGGFTEASIEGFGQLRGRDAGHAFIANSGGPRNSVPVFVPNDGKGAGAAPTSYGYLYSLEFPVPFTADGAETLHFGDSKGRSTDLLETSPTSLLFRSADGHIQVSVTIPPQWDPLRPDRSTISFTNDFEGIRERADILLESGLDTSLFRVPRPTMTVKFATPPSMGAVDTISLSLNADLAPLSISGDFQETGNSSGVFELADVRVALVGLEELSPTIAETVTAVVTAPTLGLDSVVVRLVETAPSALVFTNRIGLVGIGTDRPSRQPAASVFRILEIAEPSTDTSRSVTLTSAIDSVGLSLDRVSADTFRSKPIVAVAKDADVAALISAGFTIVHTRSIVGRAMDLTVSGSPEDRSKAPKQAFFAGYLENPYTAGYTDEAGHPDPYPTKTNPPRIARIFDGLGYTQTQVDLDLTKAGCIAAMPTHSVWYSLTHGWQRKTDNKFGGLWIHAPPGATPEENSFHPDDIPMGDREDLDYRLLYLGCCGSGSKDDDGNKLNPVTDEFMKVTKAKVIVTWKEFGTGVPSMAFYAEELFAWVAQGLALRGAHGIVMGQKGPKVDDYKKFGVEMFDDGSGKDLEARFLEPK